MSRSFPMDAIGRLHGCSVCSYYVRLSYERGPGGELRLARPPRPRPPTRRGRVTPGTETGKNK